MNITSLLLDVQFQRPFEKLILKLENWLDVIILKTPNIILGVLALFFFVIASKIVSKLIGKIADKITDKENFKFLITRSSRYSIQLMGLIVALNVVGLDKTVTSLLAGAGIIGLALSFAFQNIATNFISGILISLRHTYQVGEWIKTIGIEGKVNKITIYNTEILTETGQYVTVPNKEILESPLYNFTRNNIREVELIVGISYNDDLDAVMGIVENAMKNVSSAIAEKPIRLYYKEFADSSINMEVNFWIHFDKQHDYDIAISDAIRCIKREFNANNISIPFPIRTIELNQGNPQ